MFINFRSHQNAAVTSDSSRLMRLLFRFRQRDKTTEVTNGVNIMKNTVHWPHVRKKQRLSGRAVFSLGLFAALIVVLAAPSHAPAGRHCGAEGDWRSTLIQIHGRLRKQRSNFPRFWVTLRQFPCTKPVYGTTPVTVLREPIETRATTGF